MVFEKRQKSFEGKLLHENRWRFDARRSRKLFFWWLPLGQRSKFTYWRRSKNLLPGCKTFPRKTDFSLTCVKICRPETKCSRQTPHFISPYNDISHSFKSHPCTGGRSISCVDKIFSAKPKILLSESDSLFYLSVNFHHSPLEITSLSENFLKIVKLFRNFEILFVTIDTKKSCDVWPGDYFPPSNGCTC